MKMLHRIKKLCRVLLCVMALSLLLPAGQVRAEEGIESPELFDELSGDAKYLQEDYRNNYILDIEETGVLEVHWASINGIANALFTAIRYLALGTVTVFYYAVTFDVGEIFGEEINSIQSALHDTIFEPLLILAICACFVTLLMKYVRKDFVGGAVELGKVIFVIVLSMLVVAKSDSVLSGATNITKEIGIEALASVNDTGGLPQGKEDFAAEAAGILWVDLVHEPWKTVEFMHSGEPDEDVIEEFLGTSEAEERAELVKEFGEDAACFKMTIGFERIGFLIVYFIPCIAKCALFLIISGALLIFQILAVFYLVLAVIMLLLFLFAGYESILGAWLKKLLETQIMILVLMLMLSLLIRTDVFLFEQVGEWGWFVVLIIQIIMGVGLYIGRGQIFNMLSTVQRGTATPRYLANRLRTGGNISQISAMQKKAAAASQRIIHRTGVQQTAASGTGNINVRNTTAAQKITPRPVFQTVQNAATNAKPVMEATDQKVQQAGKTAVQKVAVNAKPVLVATGRAVHTGTKAGKQTSVQQSIVTGAGAVTASNTAATQKTTARPVFQTVQKVAVNAKPVMAATGQVVHAGIKAGKQAGAYVHGGGLGRSMGMAAGAMQNVVPAMKDSAKNAAEYAKSAPIEFQYGVYQQTEKIKANATALKTETEHKYEEISEKTGKALEYVGEKTINAGMNVVAVSKSNYTGVKEGYAESRKRAEAGKATRMEKQEAYKRGVEAKRQVLQEAAEKKASQKAVKKERPKFQQPKKEEHT